jgi:hypothetical protein
MNTNLVLVTGLAYGVLGAVILAGSHWSLHRLATRLVAGYPRVIAKLNAKHHDGRFGLVLLTSGGVLQALAAHGYSAPLSHWRYPVYAAVAAVCAYVVWRLISASQSAAPRAKPAANAEVRSIYETRRSVRLREAARVESATLEAMERRRAPRDTGVVYLAREWDRRWWSEKFGVSVEALTAAIRQVGPMTRDVERYFGAAGTTARAVAA